MESGRELAGGALEVFPGNGRVETPIDAGGRQQRVTRILRKPFARQLRRRPTPRVHEAFPLRVAPGARSEEDLFRKPPGDRRGQFVLSSQPASGVRVPRGGAARGRSLLPEEAQLPAACPAVLLPHAGRRFCHDERRKRTASDKLRHMIPIQKTFRGVTVLALVLFLAARAACGAGEPDMKDSMARLEKELSAKYGEAERPRLSRGLRQVAEFWRAPDGDAAAFEEFVRSQFAGDAKTLDALFDRMEFAF